MKINYLLILIISTLLVSCGPSQEEIETRAKFVSDSLETVKVQEEKERMHLQKIEVGQSLLQTKFTNIVNKLKVDLDRQNNKINTINEFQWGRAQSTKDEELRSQYEKISEIEKSIKRIEKEISFSKLFNSFDFQKSPQGTINHIFYAAKNNDYTKLRHIVDPYGEYDESALSICFVQMLSKYEKSKWKSLYVNGRIMSDPIVTKDHAEVEIAVGASSNRLEKVKLINRMGKWYILGY